MPKEIELKLSVVGESLAVLENLEECLSNQGLVLELQRKPLQNIYYDTPDKILNQHRMALRVRKKGDAFIQTLKTKGKSVSGLSERGEWEWELADNKLDISLLEGLDVWPEGMNLDSLNAVFETNFVRHQVLIEWQGSEIELAFDQGEVLSKGKCLPIKEIELELMSGDVEALKSLAAVLGQAIHLKASDTSKAERGYSLLAAS